MSDSEEDEMQMIEEEEDEDDDELQMAEEPDELEAERRPAAQARPRAEPAQPAAPATAGADVEERPTIAAVAAALTLDLDNVELEEDGAWEEETSVMQSSASTAPGNVVSASPLTDRKFLDSMIIRVPVASDNNTSNRSKGRRHSSKSVPRPQPRPGKGPMRSQSLHSSTSPVRRPSAMSTDGGRRLSGMSGMPNVPSDGASEAQKRSKPGVDTFIFQPGSLNLVYGRASDLTPKMMANVIAWRVAEPPGAGAEPEGGAAVAGSFREQHLGAVDREVRRDQGRRDTQQTKLRPSVPLDEATSFNRRCTPDTVAISEDQSALWWTDVSHAPEYVVGDAALSINPSEPYELFYPVRDGRLNTSSTRSKQSSFDDVVRIWTYAIEHTLGVTKKEFSNHKILIIVPDLFERETIKSFLDIALHELRFCAAFCHQESVCTSFGAGLQSAAVINVGHTTTSVSCVDDGISVPASRLRLNFGGDDIARTLFWLLGRIHFPFRECSLASRMDRLMLRDLAHRLCRASSGGCSVAQTEFFVRGEHGLDRYGLKYTDQPIAAVMGLFVPGFFGLDPTSVELVRQRRDVTVPADDSVYGNEAAQEFQIMVKTTMASPTTPMSPQSMSAFSSRRSSEANGTSVTRRESIVSPLGAAGAASSPGKAPEGRIMSLGAGSGKRRRVSDANAMTYQGDAPELASNPGGSDIVAILKNRSEAEEVGLGLLGIDEAVSHSISRCSTDVVKKNMYQNIVFAGGCALCPGLAKTLEARLRFLLPTELRRTVDRINVVARAKGQDPRCIPWKGASVAARLTTVQDAWILQSEWEEMGVRVAREKAPFLW